MQITFHKFICEQNSLLVVIGVDTEPIFAVLLVIVTKENGFTKCKETSLGKKISRLNFTADSLIPFVSCNR